MKTKIMLHLERRGLSQNRKEKYRIVLNKLGAVDLKNLSKNDVDDFFLHISNSILSGETKKSYWVIFRIMVKMLNPSIDLSEYKLNTHERKKRPEDMLSFDTVHEMIESRESVRDKAIISLLFDLGCRPGELLNMRHHDVIFDSKGTVITLDGKTGERTIRIVTTLGSDKHLSQWMSICKEDLLFNMTDANLNKIIKSAATSVGIKKRVHPYILRHSRVTHLAKHMTEQEMKVYFGWEADSKMLRTYSHLTGRDLDPVVLRLNGTREEASEPLRDPEFMRFMNAIYREWNNKGRPQGILRPMR